MAYPGVHLKIGVIADFVEELATSVHRAGDSPDLSAAAERIVDQFYLPPVRWPGPVPADRSKRQRPDACR